MMVKEIQTTLGKTFPNSTLSTTYTTWTELGAKPVLRGEKPVTNRGLNYGTAKKRIFTVGDQEIGRNRKRIKTERKLPTFTEP